MGQRTPDEIWEEGLDEGERRLARRPAALAATGFAGGVDVFFGILALAVVYGALQQVLPSDTAKVLAASVFGIGFAFITIGRAELFTENFLIPVSAVQAGRARVPRLLSMWVITLLFNAVGLILFAALFSVDGVLTPEAQKAAGDLADAIGERAWLPSLLSAIAAGTIMTLFTWVVEAAEGSAARVIASLLVGILLALPSLNHAIVAIGELSFGLFCGTTDVGLLDAGKTFVLAVVGNLIGGVGLVFTTRLAQVRGEPDSTSGGRPGEKTPPS